jgi:hypothetical protein
VNVFLCETENPTAYSLHKDFIYKSKSIRNIEASCKHFSKHDPFEINSSLQIVGKAF